MKKKREGSISQGHNVIVTEVDRFEEGDDICCWIVVYTDSDLVIIAKIVSDEMDLRICFEPEDFMPGTRTDILNNDCHWLFAPPEDEEDFIPSELDFADEIVNNDNDQQITFKIKGGTFYGSCDGRFAAITEWAANSECQNPELIAFETGGLDDDGDPVDEGGYVQFFQGVTVEDHDIELMPV